MVKKLIFLTVVFILLLTNISYGGQTWSIPQTVAEVPGQSIWAPKIAVSPDGTWHVVYYEIADTEGSYPIYSYIRYYNSKSEHATIAQAVHPNQCQGNALYDPDIAADSNGNLHVTYKEVNWVNDCDLGISSIKHMNNVSGAWSTPQTIAEVPGQNIWAPKITVSPDGTWHVIYYEIADTSGALPAYFYIRYYNSRSEHSTIAQAVLSTECEGNSLYDADIAADSNGNLHVTYRVIIGDSGCGEVSTSIKYMNNVSGAWSTSQTIAEVPSQNIWAPQITVSPDGTWHVVYYEIDSTSDSYPFYHSIRYRNSKSDYSTIDRAVKAGECEDNILYDPDIAADSNGNLHVTYTDINWAGECGEGISSIKYINNSAGLFTMLPTLNDHSSKMIETVRKMFQYDDECLIGLCEAKRDQDRNRSWSPLFSATAYGESWSTTKNLTRNTGSSRWPAIAVNRSNIYVVWEDNTPGNSEIYFKKSVDGGTTWEPNTRLTTNAGHSRQPAIAVNSSNMYVVWENRTNGNWEIYFKNSDDRGAIWKAEKRLTNNAGDSYSPAIAVDGLNIYVAWTDNTPGNPEIYFKKSIDGGTTWTTNKRLTNNAGISERLSMAVDGSHIYVVWEDSTTGYWEIYFKSSADGGNTWKTEKRLTTNAGDSYYPAIAVDSSNIYVVWTDNAPGNPEIYFKKSTDRGATWTTNKRLTTNAGDSYSPAIAVDGSNIYLVWYNKPGKWEVYFKKSIDGGDTWITKKPSYNAGWSLFPAIAVDGTNIYVVWTDNTPGNFDIYFKKGILF